MLSLDALPNEAPPEYELLHPDANATITLNSKADTQMRDTTHPPAERVRSALVAEIHILQRQLHREPFDVLNHRLQIVALLA